MNIFQILVSCSSPELAVIMNAIKNILNLIQIIGPLLLICSLVFLLIKMMRNPEDKKTKSRFKNSVIALGAIFFIPLLVNVVMRMAGSTYEISACWNQNTSVSLSPSYIQTNNEGENRKNPFSDSSSYEQGTPKPSSSTSTSSSSSSSSSSISSSS